MDIYSRLDSTKYEISFLASSAVFETDSLPIESARKGTGIP